MAPMNKKISNIINEVDEVRGVDEMYESKFAVHPTLGEPYVVLSYGRGERVLQDG